MLTCLECIERLKPDDPRIPVGRYSQSSCDYYCDKPAYYRELEKPRETTPEPKWVGRQWDRVQQNTSELRSWRQKHAEMTLALDKLNKKKPESKWE